MDRLDPRLREELLALGPRRDYRAGQRLLMEGAATTHVFLIVTGVVKVTATAKERGPAVLAMRHEGDLVGELAAMDGSPRSASVVACRQVTAHEIGRAAFLAFRDRPGVSPVVSSTVNDKLRAANRRRLEFTGFPVRTRIARILVEFGPEYGQRSPTGEVLVHLTQEEIAGTAGAALVTVQQEMAKLRSQGLTGKGYGWTAIRRLDDLVAVGWPGVSSYEMLLRSRRTHTS